LAAYVNKLNILTNYKAGGRTEASRKLTTKAANASAIQCNTTTKLQCNGIA